MSQPEPGSPEWNRLVTASKVAAIIGVSPYDSPRSMWHKMRGDVVDQASGPQLARGNYLEAGVLDWWQGQHPEAFLVEPQFYATRDDLPWAAATLDALAYDNVSREPLVVEVKTASRMDDWGAPGTDQIPVHYLTQVYWQLAMCPGAKRAYVAVLGPFLEFSEYIVERDDAIQADLVARCATFYASLTSDTPPPLDDHVATIRTIRAMHPEVERGQVAYVAPDLAVEYLAACAAEKTATARARAAKAAIFNAAGKAQYVEANGVRIARRQPSRNGISLIPTATPNDIQENAA